MRLTCSFIIAARFIKAVDDEFSKSIVKVSRTDLKVAYLYMRATVVGAGVAGAGVEGVAVVDAAVAGATVVVLTVAVVSVGVARKQTNK